MTFYFFLKKKLSEITRLIHLVLGFGKDFKVGKTERSQRLKLAKLDGK